MAGAVCERRRRSGIDSKLAGVGWVRGQSNYCLRIKHITYLAHINVVCNTHAPEPPASLHRTATHENTAIVVGSSRSLTETTAIENIIHPHTQQNADATRDVVGGWLVYIISPVLACPLRSSNTRARKS